MRRLPWLLASLGLALPAATSARSMGAPPPEPIPIEVRCTAEAYVRAEVWPRFKQLKGLKRLINQFYFDELPLEKAHRAMTLYESAGKQAQAALAAMPYYATTASTAEEWRKVREHPALQTLSTATLAAEISFVQRESLGLARRGVAFPPDVLLAPKGQDELAAISRPLYAAVDHPFDSRSAECDAYVRSPAGTARIRELADPELQARRTLCALLEKRKSESLEPKARAELLVDIFGAIMTLRQYEELPAYAMPLFEESRTHVRETASKDSKLAACAKLALEKEMRSVEEEMQRLANEGIVPEPRPMP